MKQTLLIVMAIVFPATLGAIVALQVYKKKTATYMPLKNEFVHWKK
ncbi:MULTISPECIES: hypothetical protein [Listeria]|nr:MULTISPECIES: hypothetical protein [Listeria]